MAEMQTNGRRVVFENRITLGNVLTILGGIGVCAGWIVAFVWYQAALTAKVDWVQQNVAQIKCDLASVGIGSTTSPCMFNPRVQANGR